MSAVNSHTVGIPVATGIEPRNESWVELGGDIMGPFLSTGAYENTVKIDR